MKMNIKKYTIYETSNKSVIRFVLNLLFILIHIFLLVYLENKLSRLKYKALNFSFLCKHWDVILFNLYVKEILEKSSEFKSV